MNKIKLGQIWCGTTSYSDAFISIKINTIEDNLIGGVIIAKISYNNHDDYLVVGHRINFDNIMFFETRKFKLVKDIIGEKCTICNKFYNEAVNNFHFNTYFRCWECELRSKFVERKLIDNELPNALKLYDRLIQQTTQII